MVPRCPLLSRAGGSDGTKTLIRSCLLVLKSTILPRPLSRLGAEGTSLTFFTRLGRQARCLGGHSPVFSRMVLKGQRALSDPFLPGRVSRASQPDVVR